MKEMPRISPIERLLNERLLQNLRSASLYTEGSCSGYPICCSSRNELKRHEDYLFS